MNSPLTQLMLLTVVVGIGLWGTMNWFVGGTEDLAASLDIRSLAYVRNDTPSNSERKEEVVVEPLPPAAFAAANPMPTLEELPDQENPSPEDEEEAEDEEENADEDEADTEEGQEEEVLDAEVHEDAEHEEVEGSSLSEEEITAREQLRRDKLAEVGLVQEKPPEPTIAADASLIMPDECLGSAVAKVPVALKFRFESSRIKGESLNELESLLALQRQCEQGKFLIDENPLGRTDADEFLVQMRLDEIKYFFLQHNVSLDLVEFPEGK